MRTVAILALAVLLIGALVWSVQGAFFSNPASYPAQVNPGKIVYLDFPSVADVQTLSVSLGETIRSGSVLASQESTLDKLKLAYDQATLNVDTANLTALQSNNTATAAQRQLALTIQLAQEGVAAAEVQLQDATTPGEQALAQEAVAEAETRLALAENSQQTSPSAAANTQIAASTAAVAAAQASVAGDQVAIAQTVLTAPAAGVIAAINGQVGELAGPDGVTNTSTAPAALPQAPSFQLFPPASQSPASKQQTGFVPFITLYVDAPWQAVVQVPQAGIGRVALRERTQVQVAGGRATLYGYVLQINPQPVVVAGATYYDVVCTLTSRPAWLLSGMSGNATFIRGS